MKLQQPHFTSPPQSLTQTTNNNHIMRTATLTPEDEKYLTLLEHHRDHKMQRPLLSNFRVLALFAYEDLDGKQQYVIGANVECANIGGAICAERSAISQLQLLPAKRVLKVYIVSDADVCLTPGTLCREFLSSSPLFTPQTPFISRATNCKPCITNLEELYPHPCIYDRLPRTDVLPFAQTLCQHAVDAAKGTNKLPSQEGNEEDQKKYPSFVRLQLSSMTPEEQAVYLAAFEATARDARDDLFPLRYAAAALFSDGEIRVTWQHKTLEYGSSLDAVSKLIPFIDDKQLGKSYKFDASSARAHQEAERTAAHPVFVVQVDQFGLLHAPFARVRAFFFEYEYKDLVVLVHDSSATLHRVQMQQLVAESPDCIATTTANTL